MKPQQTLLFLIALFLLLGVVGWLIPSGGVQIGSLTLRFPSPRTLLAADTDTVVDVEQTMEELKRQTDLSRFLQVEDSLRFYRHYLAENHARFHFPDNDFTFLDSLFAQLEQAQEAHSALHIIHYGDSQIEIDRITSDFRQTLQEQFGGEGAGLVPAIQTIPSFSVSQSYSGNLTRFALYGDTLTRRASHRRYGPLGTVAHIDGSATLSLGKANYQRTQEGVKTFSKVVLLVGNTNAGFSAQCQGITKTIDQAKKGVTPLTWTFDAPVSRVSMALSGSGELYGASMEGECGVAVANVPMRGCSGTIFTRIDSTTLADSYRHLNVGAIIMQFGGNMMPQIGGERSITKYMSLISEQIDYLQKCNPEVTLFFIGPSDMSKRVDGKMQTYPYLPALNDSLRETVLAKGGVYWDMYRVMGGKNSMLSWVDHKPAWASPDYVHFTNEGAQEIAEALSDAFMTYYQFYQLRRHCSSELVEQFMNEAIDED